MIVQFLITLASELQRTSALYSEHAKSADAETPGAGDSFRTASVLCLALSNVATDVARHYLPETNSAERRPTATEGVEDARIEQTSTSSSRGGSRSEAGPN